MSVIFESLRIYRETRILTMLFLGFSAGLPLPLTAFTLRQWFSESGVALSAIGLTALVGIAYSFKFAWAPFLDRLRPPALTRGLGQRRGWLLPIQIALAVSIALMGFTDPRLSPEITAAAAVLVAFFSASQDIVIDAYRIERLAPEEQGAGLAAYIWGYRIALLAGNAGVLFLVGHVDWRGAYTAMAVLIGVGAVTCLVMREPVVAEVARRVTHGVLDWLKLAIIGPLADFARRDAWVVILAFIVLFKLGEALAGIMTAPFYRAIGFSREEVAAVSSVFGLFATLGGVAVGGLVVHQLGVYRALIATGLLQMLSNLMYVLLAYTGHDVPVLFLQVGIESFTDGLADAAFVAYLSSLTNVAFTATQYALLSSLATVPLRTLGAGSGWLAEGLGWPLFFILTTAAALPALCIALWLMRRFPMIAKPVQVRDAGDP
jgi:PAT family beta-lactamase induction signal transducer AmpG